MYHGTSTLYVKFQANVISFLAIYIRTYIDTDIHL